ncbi:MAG TPA: chemotaxis protein CheA [Thermodesulfovibrionales bacterium]|nr:chemotaxis protein CheA [Thermodesulfovibrionales bacterium]
MPDEMEEIIADFITEAEESLDKIDPLFVEFETKGYDKEMLNDIFRSMHTLKGAAGFLGFQHIVDVAHSAENIMKKLRENEISLSRYLMDVILKSVDMLRLLIQHIKLKDGIEEDTVPLVNELEEALKKAQEPGGHPETIDPPGSAKILPEVEKEKGRELVDVPVETKKGVAPQPAAETGGEKTVAERKESLQTLRVDINRIDNVMDLTGEVVMVRNRLLNIVNYLETKFSDDVHVENLTDTVNFLDLVTSDMQLAVMRMRMQPIKKVFGKFPRLVRDIAGPLGKQVELLISGEETEVDKTVIEQIGDPMVHIIRNAIDHGLESTEVRLAKGKPEKGTITISACQKGNQIVIEVSDDGKGIDVDRVKKKALEKALISGEEAERMTDESAINLIFLPGFSTSDVATELSGRGVGMDVVKTNISKLNGYVEVASKKDAGSTFRISIPLTLAIVQALMVRVGTSNYAIPLAPVEEIRKVSRSEIDDVVGQKVLVIRGRVNPLFELSSLLGNPAGSDAEYRYATVVSIGESQFCLAVDELLGQEEVVIKSIDGLETASSHILGATITGEGKVVLILDLASIARSVSGAIKNL